MNGAKHYIDLHVHTNFSDGSFSPQEAVQYAKHVGLQAISITDHDSVKGIESAIEEGLKEGVEVIPGIELSAEMENAPNTEMHILGYFLDYKNPELLEKLELFSSTRKMRAKEILSKLKDLGINLDTSLLPELDGVGNIGRLHFAKALVKGGHASCIADVFQRLLGFSKPAYVPKYHIKPKDAIDLILKSGGIPVIAHPYYIHFNYPNIISELSLCGLKGIEVWHSKHPQGAVKIFSDLAFELGLVATGGSDCHGRVTDDSPSMGRVKVPYSALVELKKCKAKLDKLPTSFV